MEKLRAYIKNLPRSDRDEFARRCGTTLGYLRSGASAGKKFSAELCLAIERESACAVTVADLQPALAREMERSGYARLRSEARP